jgi:hypothetical protein
LLGLFAFRAFRVGHFPVFSDVSAMQSRRPSYAVPSPLSSSSCRRAVARESECLAVCRRGGVAGVVVRPSCVVVVVVFVVGSSSAESGVPVCRRKPPSSSSSSSSSPSGSSGRTTPFAFRILVFPPRYARPFLQPRAESPLSGRVVTNNRGKVSSMSPLRGAPLCLAGM